MADEEKKKVIIALKGREDSGKTTTLRKLALEFLESPDVEEDIQVGFLYKRKMAMSTTGDDKAIAFAEVLKATFHVQATEILGLINGGKEISTSFDGSKERLNSDKARALRDFLKELLKLEEGPKSHEAIKSPNLLGELLKLKKLLNSDETITLRNIFRELLEMEEVEADIQISFVYKDKRIVISTAGDTEPEVKESTGLFQRVVEEDIKVEGYILVTATRTRGCTTDALKEVAKTDINWIKKDYSESEHDSTNEKQAKELRAFIDLIIDNWDSEPKK